MSFSLSLSIPRSLTLALLCTFFRKKFQGGKKKNIMLYMWQNVYFFIFTWLRSVQNWIYRFMRHNNVAASTINIHIEYRVKSDKNMKMCSKSKNILQKIMVNLFLFQSFLLTMCVSVSISLCLSQFHSLSIRNKHTHARGIWWEFIRNVHACLQAAYFLCVFCVLAPLAYNSLWDIHTHTYTNSKCVQQIQRARMCFMCTCIHVNIHCTVCNIFRSLPM